MKRSTEFPDESLESELVPLAQRQGRSRSALIRDALERYVTRERQRPARLTFVATGKIRCAETAQNHERLLFRHRS